MAAAQLTAVAAHPRTDCALPSWAFSAWVTVRHRGSPTPRPALTGSVEAAAESRRLARLQRDLVPQDDLAA